MQDYIGHCRFTFVTVGANRPHAMATNNIDTVFEVNLGIFIFNKLVVCKPIGLEKLCNKIENHHLISIQNVHQKSSQCM